MTTDTKLDIDLITKCIEIIRSDVYEITDIYKPYMSSPSSTHNDIEMLLLKLESKIRTMTFEINTGLKNNSEG